MKILFPVHSNPYFDSSAIGNRYESLLSGLLNHNVEITVLVLGGFNSIDEFNKKGVKNNNPNLKVKYLIFTFQNSLWLRRFNKYILSPIINSFLISKLKKEYIKDYNFIWLTGNLPLRKSVLNNLNYLADKTKIFIELSEFQGLHKFEQNNSIGYVNDWQDEYTNVTEKLLRHVDCFAIMTKTLINYYKDLAKNQNAKFIHLPMTVDLDRFNNVLVSIRWRKPYIAFTGTYTNSKDGVDVLIKAFNIIHSEFPQHQLLLAGFYHPDVISQKELINKFKLENNIKYIGLINKEEIPAFLINADFLVLPRPYSKQAEGGFPTKLGEYLATGNPVCATTVGEIPDYLVDGESVYFAEPGSVDSFANAMRRVLSNPQEAKRIGANGRKVAEKYFNKDIQAKVLYDFLKNEVI